MNDIPPSPAGGLYSDITEAGGMTAAFATLLSEISPLRSGMTIQGSRSNTSITSNGSSCGISMALHERIFFSDFWRDGILHGKLTATNPHDIARAVHAWLGERPTLAEMRQRFPLFKPSENGRAHEEGRTVEYQWGQLYARWKRSLEIHPSNDFIRDLILLIEAAGNVPLLRQLYPFTSHYRLHFSRVTGHPFARDAPFAVPLGNGRYQVCSAQYRIVKRTAGPGGYDYDEPVHEILGDGTADEAIALVVANLPPGYGPAVPGTAEEPDW